MTKLLLLLLRWTAWLPLSWVRGLGYALGLLLMLLLGSRRRVVLTNLRLCFPDWSAAQRRRAAVRVFLNFAQAWLDRGWLWYGDAEQTRRRVRLVGAVEELADPSPVVLFAPHFMGLDAGGVALLQQVPRPMCSIYSPQKNAAVDAWIKRGRQRYGSLQLFSRGDGIKGIVASVKAGQMLYLLPDMNFDPKESLFVPFYGNLAATVPSLPRFARLARARVVPVVSRLTASGYEVQILPAWTDYPSGDWEADTALMNLRLQDMIDSMPDQYYWVHKRFKDRPPGAAAVY